MSAEWKRAEWVHDMTGTGPGHTTATLMDAISSFLLQTGWSLASWSLSPTTDRYYLRTDRATETTWRYTGDGATQHAGIHVKLVTASTRVEFTGFLENVDATASQRDTTSATAAYLTYSTLAATTLLFVGGEDGFYLEGGRDGVQNNAGHLFMATMQAITEFGSVRPDTINWACPGAVFDLTGSVKFCNSRTQYAIATDGSGHLSSVNLFMQVARGCSSILTANPTNDRSYFIGCMDAMMVGQVNASIAIAQEMRCTFAIPQNAFDDAHRISPIVYYANASDTLTISSATGAHFYDIRALRKIRRFTAVSWSALAFSYLLDTITGINYRVAYVPDGGRSCNIGVPWPDASNILTITP